MRRLKWLILIVLALALMFSVPLVALADTSAEVTVTAVPTYVSITNSPNAWTINGLTGDGKIDKATTYYSNPGGDEVAPSATVVDGECRFTVNSTSSVNINLTINFANFTGGDAMTNGNSGAGGVGTFGAKSYFSGTAWEGDAVIAQNSGSDVAYANMSAGEIMWGLMVAVQTDDFTSGESMEAAVNISAAES